MYSKVTMVSLARSQETTKICLNKILIWQKKYTQIFILCTYTLVGIIWDLQEKKWKIFYNYKNISVLSGCIYMKTQAFFFSSWNQLLQTGENLQHHCHLLTCVKSMSSQSITMYRDFLSLLKSGRPDTSQDLFWTAHKNSGHNHTTTTTTTIMTRRHCVFGIFCDDILTIIL